MTHFQYLEHLLEEKNSLFRSLFLNNILIEIDESLLLNHSLCTYFILNSKCEIILNSLMKGNIDPNKKTNLDITNYFS